jgi:hypothetical protein
VHGDAREVVALQMALAGVYAGADLEAGEPIFVFLRGGLVADDFRDVPENTGCKVRFAKTTSVHPARFGQSAKQVNRARRYLAAASQS